MHIPHHLLLSVGVVLMASCGGGGGGGDKASLAQPPSFLPEGVTTAELQFASKSGLESVRLTQKTENTKSVDAAWTATVSDSRVRFSAGGMQIDAELIGEVEVTRQAGDQGFLLTWRDPDSYAAGQAALVGSMQLRYYNMNDNSGFRQASVTSPGIKLVYSDNGETTLEKDFAPGLDGTSVQVSFSLSKPQTPPASNQPQEN